jgi:hypothetical protein
MKEKRESENRKGGLVKKEKMQGSWAKCPSSSLARVQNRGGEPSGWPAGQGCPPAARARRRPVDRAKRRGRRRGSIPVLTLSWGGAWRWIGGRRRTAGWAALVAARCGAGEREMACGGVR